MFGSGDVEEMIGGGNIILKAGKARKATLGRIGGTREGDLGTCFFLDADFA